MSRLTNFVSGLDQRLKSPTLAGGAKIVQPAPKRTPISTYQEPKRGFLDRALDFISPALAPIQRAISRPDIIKPIFKEPKNANLGQKLRTGVFNLPTTLFNSVIGQGLLKPTADATAVVRNTAQGKPLPKYEELLSAHGRLGYQIGSGATGQKNIAPQKGTEYLGNIAGVANPIIDAYSPKGLVNIFKAPTETIAKKFLGGALYQGGIAGASGLSLGLSENRDAKSILDQLTKAAPTAATAAAFGATLGGLTGGGSGIWDALAGKTSKQLGISKEAAKKVNEGWFRDRFGKFTSKDKAINVESPVKVKINRQLGRPDDTPVFHSDMKRALGYDPFEEVEKRIGLQSRPTDDIAAAQLSKETQPLKAISTAMHKSDDFFMREVADEIDKLPQVNAQNADTAVIESISGNPNASGLGALPKKLQNTFKDLVNSRSASSVVQRRVKNDFRNLDKYGQQGLIDFSKGVKNPDFDQARNFFDQIFTSLKQKGFDFNYKENYLTGLYKESPEQVNKIFRRLGLNPSFTKESFFRNYEEAIRAGLTPKYNNLSDVISHYAGSVNRAVANKEAWDTLTAGGFISPKPRPGWMKLDQDAFPSNSFKYVDEGGRVVTHSGVFYAPEDLAKPLNNYFKQPNSILQSIADFSSTVKNIVLSSGIPGTGINFHGFTTLFRSGFNPKAGYYLLRPKAAEKYLDANLGKLDFFVRKGLKATTEEHVLQNNSFLSVLKTPIKNVPKQALDSLLSLQRSLFEDPLFQRVLPALKVQKAEAIYKQLTKKGIGSDEAARLASEQANNFFGGINWEQMGRNRDFQNTLRSVFLAPDLLETQGRLGVGIAKSLLKPTSPEGKSYRDFARNFVLSYILLNVANKESTGKWAFENEKGHEFELRIGDTYLRPYASGADFLRLPFDVVKGIASGDLSAPLTVARNRTSGPVQTFTSLVSQTNRFGDPLFKNKFTGEPLKPSQQAGNFASDVLGPIGLPSYVQAGLRVGSGNQTPLRGLTQALELPIRFAPKKRTPTSKRRAGRSSK